MLIENNDILIPKNIKIYIYNKQFKKNNVYLTIRVARDLLKKISQEYIKRITKIKNFYLYYQSNC